MKFTTNMFAVFLIGTILSSHHVLGEWYHAANDQGRDYHPDVLMSMQDNIGGPTSGTFHYTKDDIEESAIIASSQPPVGDFLVDDGPGYLSPGMSFDGTTYVDLGDQTGSCFGNFDLCPDGWTMSLWVKVTTFTGLIFESGPYNFYLGILLYTHVSGTLRFRMVGGHGRCALEDTITLGEWYYVGMSYHEGDCTSVVIQLGDVTSFSEKSVLATDAGTHVSPTIKNMVLGAKRDHSNLGTFSMDELAVWYRQVDPSIMKFMYTYQVHPLGHVCENDAYCSNGMNSTQCRHNTNWGVHWVDMYCQCKGITTLTATYAECVGSCPLISKDAIKLTALAIEAKKLRKP